MRTESPPKIEEYDYCVIGAGVAGLNALAVARSYLPASARVLLVDRRPREGGMWTDTYDYVRLHQPHRMFTAGDIPWSTHRAPEYLADKSEVLSHLAECLEACEQNYSLETRFGSEFVSSSEEQIDGIWLANIELREIATGETIRIRARRCMKAFGFRVPQNPPLLLDSSGVNSITPDGDDLYSEAFSNSTGPCFIVGGGKTAMDTATNIMNRFPHKRVSMIVGRGTVFLNRDKTFHRGLKRWLGGETTLEGFLRLALLYNGENETEVMDYFKQHMSIQLDDEFENYFFGILSERENDKIKTGLDSLIKDYLVDVKDGESSPRIEFRSGQTMDIPSGSWIINCTGYIARQEHDYEPYLSQHATTVSVQPTSGIHFLTTFGAYFLAHLHFLDLLPKLKLYELDYQSLLRKNKNGFAFTAISHTMYNILLILDAVPSSVFTRCGLDFDNWFPFYRRFLGGTKLRLNNAAYRDKFRAALDKVRGRYQIRCGELRT